jgi:hypothetical protein
LILSGFSIFKTAFTPEIAVMLAVFSSFILFILSLKVNLISEFQVESGDFKVNVLYHSKVFIVVSFFPSSKVKSQLIEALILYSSHEFKFQNLS